MIDIMNIGLSGMQTFQKGLANIGNNLTNLNSPGFKRTAMQYSDLFYQYQTNVEGAYTKGLGVKIATTTTDFSQGTLQSSNNALDLAINGNGFFVTRREGQNYYSRVGQFNLDLAGFLINRVNKSKVQSFSDGRLQDFSIAELKQQSAKATTKVSLTDNLSTGSETASVDISVYDAVGIERKLTMTLTNQSMITSNSWKVEIEESGKAIGIGEIKFNANGAPEVGFNEVMITLGAANGTSSQILFDFGLPGTLSGVTQLSGGTTSTIKVGQKDGYTAGNMTELKIDEEGYGVITYSNGESQRGPRLALANVAEPDQQLKRVGSGEYLVNNEKSISFGYAGSDNFGKVAGKQLELSNVDLSAEFSEMMITQRGYQSASQLISAANEMMQQALQMKNGR